MMVILKQSIHRASKSCATNVKTSKRFAMNVIGASTAVIARMIDADEKARAGGRTTKAS